MTPTLVLRTVAMFVALQAVASPEPLAFGQFTQLVRDYLKLVKAAPRQRTTKKPGDIAERRRERAQTIRETRPNAKPGDIFTPEISEAFRQAIRSAFQGPGGLRVRKTIREGTPLPDRRLIVNGDSPEHLPRTTVPPTLLRLLPGLPPEVAYRIVGHDFVLQDKEARVVLDFIPGAIP